MEKPFWIKPNLNTVQRIDACNEFLNAFGSENALYKDIKSLRDYLIYDANSKDKCEFILQVVLDVTGCTRDDFFKSAKWPHADVRKIFYYCAKDAGVNYSVMGRFVSRDHSTVMNQINELSDLMETDKIMEHKVKTCLEITKRILK